MPLSNAHLPADVAKMLEEMPLDETCLERSLMSYQTKVDMYDQKCSGCGFARIVVYTTASNNKPVIFNKIEDALKHAKGLRDCVERTCSYPDDVMVINNKVMHPSVSEIVANTCMFWREKRLNIPPDDGTNFIEITDEKETLKAIGRIAVESRTERVSEI